MDQEDELPVVDEQAVAITQRGDQWKAGDHIIRCYDALNAESYAHLLSSHRAGMVFTAPPYDVKLEGHVNRSKSARKHDFAMATGELSSPQFQSFLQTGLGLAAQFSRDGAIHFVCIDWRHLPELSSAGSAVYSELKNLCVWNKSSAGMGSLYRSQHELVAVYKVGSAAHIPRINEKMENYLPYYGLWILLDA